MQKCTKITTMPIAIGIKVSFSSLPFSWTTSASCCYFYEIFFNECEREKWNKIRCDKINTRNPYKNYYKDILLPFCCIDHIPLAILYIALLSVLFGHLAFGLNARLFTVFCFYGRTCQIFYHLPLCHPQPTKAEKTHKK